MTTFLSNDKYRANLRSTWISSPADTSLLVDAIPTNTPTIITVGWETDYETVFEITGTSGDNSSNYALTGVTRVKGANTNLPEGLDVNCLNHEEYFNQYSTQINALEASVTGMEAQLPASEVVGVTGAQTLEDKAITKRVASTTSSATPRPNALTQDEFELTAQAVTGAFVAPSGTATNGQVMIMRVAPSGTAVPLTWATGTNGYVAGGQALPTTTGATGKFLHIGFKYVTANSYNKWMCLAVSQEV